ncbi:MAG: HlyD family secretion protein [Alphaproteobacteria bacterium]|jgi:HlyD family secretion protein|nr:HlyD family secretion protein [Alphaproteobacteria bacterium]
MNARRVILLGAALFALAACAKTEDPGYQGWVEADLIFVSPDEVGRVETLPVREGDTIEKGAPLFAVDPDLQQADVEMAKASVTNATQGYERALTLLKTAAGTQKTVEDAEAALRTAQARLASAQTRLARRKMASPVTGSVQQIYYRPGELVPAGRPVVSLLPPGNIKIRFFVPETVLPKIALGDAVTIHCDGCKADVPAKVTFISRTSEFTPPVIYSLDERSKLVFLIEARTDTTGELRVGQPVDVRFAETRK